MLTFGGAPVGPMVKFHCRPMYIVRSALELCWRRWRHRFHKLQLSIKHTQRVRPNCVSYGSVAKQHRPHSSPLLSSRGVPLLDEGLTMPPSSVMPPSYLFTVKRYMSSARSFPSSIFSGCLSTALQFSLVAVSCCDIQVETHIVIVIQQ